MHTAFVLGGGGNLGALQVGMLRALVERSIRANVVVGCSVGALNGAAFCQEPTAAGLDKLEVLWQGLDGKAVLPTGWVPTAVQLARKGSALNDANGLRRVIDTLLTVERFDEMVIPFECVATALEDASEHWFSSGPVAEAILASSAIPTIYPPVKIDGIRYIDGGVVNDVPISRAVELGADRMYVLHVGNFDRPRPSPRRPADMAVQAYWIARRYRYQRDLRSLPPGLETILLPTGEAPTVRFNDFTHTLELIEQAYEASSAMLDSRARNGQ